MSPIHPEQLGIVEEKAHLLQKSGSIPNIADLLSSPALSRKQGVSHVR